MALTLGTSRPAAPPPNSALPELPALRTRNASTPTANSRLSSTSQIPSRLAIRTPSRSIVTMATFHAKSTPAVPTLSSISTASSQPETNPSSEVRRSISIASFPQPPGIRKRITANPKITFPPLLSTAESGVTSLRDATTPPPSTGRTRLKRLRIAEDPPSPGLVALKQSPNRWNGSSDEKVVAGPDGSTALENNAAGQSPSMSRSSSAQDSCSTSATTFEDVEEARRSRMDAESASVKATNAKKAKEGKGNVIVSVRVRPDAGGGGDKRSEGEWMVDGRRSLVAYRGREGGDYHYDNVFATHDNNYKVYDAAAKRLVRRVMEGYHGTVFAYGMTGTGKTFSMQGTATSPGVIPLAITDIFSYIRETPHREFLLRVSYLEIYNEKIHDLLSPPTASGAAPGASQAEEIKLREDSKRGVYASPLKEEIVQSPTQLLRVIARGDHSRRTRSTQYNAQSSRSHAVVQIVVESRERAPNVGTGPGNKRAPILPGGVLVSTLSMIDLAGSEKAAENKERRTEGAHINKSLLTLGTVIARLSSDKDSNGSPTDKEGKHLPYRDSKLTRLLQPALSGNSLVSILCTIQIGAAGSVASASGHTGETLSTLKFAARAKNNIVSHAKRSEEAYSNEADSGSKALLERYRTEIVNLRGQLESQSKAQAEREEKHLEARAQQRHEEQMLEMQLARTALKERIEHLNRLILSSKSTGVNAKGQFISLAGRPMLINTNFSNPLPKDSRSPARSLRSSASQSSLSAAHVSLQRTPSDSTVAMAEPTTESPNSSLGIDAEEDDSTGEFGEGIASFNARIRALQADLADKNRYISTLEKRLLQARRSSQARTSLAFGSTSPRTPDAGDDEQGAVRLLQEKDTEIANLRAQLDDKDRMVNALRSAARKRNNADFGSEPTSPDSRRESQHPGTEANENHGSNAAYPFSPVDLLSPQKDKEAKRKSIDEMSRFLDEMIRDRVENGQVNDGSRGSDRITQETKSEGTVKAPRIAALAASLRPTSTASDAEAAAL